MVGFGIDLCRGFPVRVEVATCRVTLLPCPSSNRTCGFPASGFPETISLGMHHKLHKHHLLARGLAGCLVRASE